MGTCWIWGTESAGLWPARGPPEALTPRAQEEGAGGGHRLRDGGTGDLERLPWAQQGAGHPDPPAPYAADSGAGPKGACWACRGLSWAWAWPQVSASCSPSPIFLLLLVPVLWASALSIHSEHKKGQKERKSPEEGTVHVSPIFTLGSPPFRLVPEEAPVTRFPSVASGDSRTACVCVC